MDGTAQREVGRGAARRRLTTITIDQGISSASNILFTVLAARLLGSAEFGLFSIVFLAYTAAQGLARALAGEPLLVRPQESQERPGEAIGTGLVLGFGGAALVGLGALAAAIWEPDVAPALVVLALCLPCIVLQDLGRYLGFATHRPVQALVVDLVWLGLAVVGLIVLVLADQDDLTWFVFAWAGSGAVSGLVVLLQHRSHPFALGTAWLRETWPFSWRYAMSFGSMQGGVLLTSVVLVAILGASDLGAVRGALLLFGPLLQLQAATSAAGVAEVSRATATDDVQRHVLRATGVTTVVAVANLAILLVLPDELGRQVLGDTWEAAERVLLPAGVQQVLSCLVTGPRSALLGLRAARTTLRVDVSAQVVLRSLTIVGAAAGGLVTAYWCLAAGQGVVALLWVTAYWRHLRQVDPARVVPAPT